jgi:hypothetical protein
VIGSRALDYKISIIVGLFVNLVVMEAYFIIRTEGYLYHTHTYTLTHTQARTYTLTHTSGLDGMVMGEWAWWDGDGYLFINPPDSGR